jgi:hypothetical protein
MLDELRALNALTVGQLNKLAAEISKDDAETSFTRLKKLEDSRPSKGQLLRGALVGGTVAPIANLALRAAAGSKARMGQPIYLGARSQLANAAHGAIFGGLVPAGQHKLETEAEKQKLREYVGTHPRGTLRGDIKKVTGL